LYEKMSGWSGNILSNRFFWSIINLSSPNNLSQRKDLYKMSKLLSLLQKKLLSLPVDCVKIAYGGNAHLFDELVNMDIDKTPISDMPKEKVGENGSVEHVSLRDGDGVSQSGGMTAEEERFAKVLDAKVVKAVLSGFLNSMR